MQPNHSFIQLPLPPIGVSVFPRKPAWVADVPQFAGLSFCRAVADATAGREQWVEAASIHVCHWAPVGLGFIEPTTAFQKGLTPRLPLGNAGLYLAPLAGFRAGLTPDVVVARGPAAAIREMADTIGWDQAAWEYADPNNLARSALHQVQSSKADEGPLHLKTFNRVLGSLEKVPGWKACTAFAFKNRGVSASFEAIIKRYLSSMSICRNSVVIPYLGGKFNISYFCAGGISWGGNYPFNVTSGWPYPLWLKLAPRIR